MSRVVKAEEIAAIDKFTTDVSQLHSQLVEDLSAQERAEGEIDNDELHRRSIEVSNVIVAFGEFIKAQAPIYPTGAVISAVKFYSDHLAASYMAQMNDPDGGAGIIEGEGNFAVDPNAANATFS